MPRIKTPQYGLRPAGKYGEYTYILEEIGVGKWIPREVPIELGRLLESLEIENKLMGGNDYFTFESLQEYAKEQIYVTRKMDAVLNNFRSVVNTNNQSFGVDSFNSNLFDRIIQAIQDNPITHEDFNDWVKDKRYLFESVFYQSTFKGGDRWEELTSREKRGYTASFERSYEENLELIINDLSKILDRYRIEY